MCVHARANVHACVSTPPPLCTTRDRELAPPRTRVGQSLLLTHTRRERAACALPCVRTCVCTRVSASSSSRGRARAGGSVKGASDDFRGFRASERAACRRRIYARSRNVTWKLELHFAFIQVDILFLYKRERGREKSKEK